MNRIRVLVTLIALALVTACGGNNGDGNASPATDQPFIQSVQGIIDNTSDSTEPQNIDGIAFDTSDTTEPGAI